MWLVNIIGAIVTAALVSLWVGLVMWVASLNMYQGLQNLIVMFSALATVGLIVYLWDDKK